MGGARAIESALPNSMPYGVWRPTRSSASPPSFSLARVWAAWYGPGMPRTEEQGQQPGAPEDDGDVQLVRAAAKGDGEALAGLYDRYSSVLLAVGQRILSNHREAEDLLHDVFLEVWRHA